MATRVSTLRNGLDTPTTLATALVTCVALVILGGAVGILLCAGRAFALVGVGAFPGRRSASRPCGRPAHYPGRSLGGRPLCRGCGRFLDRCHERTLRHRAG